jgi:hypothetical protein
VLTSSVVRQGQDEEPDGTLSPPTGLKGRCVTKWPTAQVRGADGLSTLPPGNEEALLYWARQKPAGYLASPVTKVRTYSNRLPNGLISGTAALVLVAGAGGALSAQEVADVAALFENPKKYPVATSFAVSTTINKTVDVAGTVNVLRGARRTTAEIQALVLARLAEYQSRLEIGGQGGLCYKQHIEGEIVAAAPTAIRDVVLTAPTGNTAVAWNETVVFNVMGLTFALVDA